MRRRGVLAGLVALAVLGGSLGAATTAADRAEAQAAAPDHVLVDLVPGAFYERAVRWLHGEGHTTGYQPGWYGPDRSITRAELMTLLWRMDGSPPAPASGFPDVRRDAFYTRAIDWAVHERITTGVGQTGLFMPAATVDRAQLVTMLWRADGSRRHGPAPYPDVVRSAYYAGAVDWAHATDLTTGVGQTGLFQPHALLTRGQAATFLHRLEGEEAPRSPALPAYSSSVATVTAADLPHSWRSGCPVPPSDLRRLTVRHIGFDGRPTTGPLVVHRDAVTAVDNAFRHMYDSRFPVQRVAQVDVVGGDDDAAMAANLTTAFNCRRVTGGTSFSEHAYGRAIDVNPLQNPYISRSGQVLPPGGWPYVNRGWAPGVILEGSAPVVGFAGQGWAWGGRWTSPKDYQHFSATGR
ncbi:M15 family metallopeptidase [Actinomarinicola tropica]|nr:M15 family metallopeptidase [Actinomarinicola tropica]